MATQTYQLSVVGNSAGQFVTNVLHFRMDDDGYADRLLGAKGLVDGFIANGNLIGYLAMVPDAYVLSSLKCRRVSNGGGPEWINIDHSGNQGTFGSDTQISGAGPVIILYTDGGPRRKGKVFLPGIDPTKVDGDEIAAAAITTLLAKAADLFAGFSAVGGTTPSVVACVPHHNNMALRSLILHFAVSKIVGKQRRRQLPV